MILTYLPLLAAGTFTTIAAWIFVSVISMCIGTCLGIMSCTYSRATYATYAIHCYTFIAKGIPLYVQLLIAYFALPALLCVNIPGFMAACGALIFCSSGYVTEIVRAGIDALPKGQWQAANVLGYSYAQTIQRIILPQALRIVGPALKGECEQILKSTALFATIGVMDITRAGMNIISRELNPVPVYALIAGIYLFLSLLLQLGIRLLQRNYND